MTSVQTINQLAAHRALRRAVFARDRGRCSQCGRDCEALRKQLRSLPPKQRARERQRLGIAKGRTSAWDAHHITARAEGGGDALANLATLCVWCHERETAALVGDLAAKRRTPPVIVSELMEVYGG